MEASQEASIVHDDEEESPGPLDAILNDPETQVQASKDSSPIQEAQSKVDEEEEEGMEGVIQESQHEGVAEDSEEEGPVTRGGRSLRVRMMHLLSLWLSSNCASQLVPDQLSVRGEPMRAAISSLLLRMRKKRKRVYQILIPGKTRLQHPRALQALGVGRLANVVEHGSLNGADAHHHLTDQMAWTQMSSLTRLKSLTKPRKDDV
jgi:hypothetical protein